MEQEKIKFEKFFNEELGLGNKRSEMTDDIVPGIHKVPPITIEEEVILEELGLGRNPNQINMEEKIKDDKHKQ